MLSQSSHRQRTSYNGHSLDIPDAENGHKSPSFSLSRARVKNIDLLSPVRSASGTHNVREHSFFPICSRILSWRLFLLFLFVCTIVSLNDIIPSILKSPHYGSNLFSKHTSQTETSAQEHLNAGNPVHGLSGTGNDPLHHDSSADGNLRPNSVRRQIFHRDLPTCAQSGERARSFLMVFMGHSGSSAIISELRSHPDVLIEKMEPVDHGDIAKNTTQALQFTREFFLKGIGLGKVPGFKIRPRHIRQMPEAWAALAKEFDTRIIWQYRRNTLKHAVGEYAYRYLGDVQTKEGLRSEEDVENRCSSGAGCSFEIRNMAAFHKVLVSLIGIDHLIASAASLITDRRDCLHELRYEDYLYHREGAMKDLREFLGLQDIPTFPSRYKATKDNMCNVVTNWEELCRNFYGCAVWRHLFEDDRNGCSCPFSGPSGAFCNSKLVATGTSSDTALTTSLPTTGNETK